MRNIENESVRSDRTDRSERNRGHRSHSREGKSSHRYGNGERNASAIYYGSSITARFAPLVETSFGNLYLLSNYLLSLIFRNHDNPNRDHHQKRHTRRSRSGDGRSREDRSVTINAPSGDEAEDNNSRYGGGGGRQGPYNNGGIEVSILPQNDDRWDAATAVTDATSAYTGMYGLSRVV